jgi:hypothetical protein
MANDEQFQRLKKAAALLNVPYYQIQRAAKKQVFPTYFPFGRRPYVRISEIVAAFEASRKGGNSNA